MLELDVGYPLVHSSSLERAARSIVLLDTLSVRKKEMYFLFESSSRSRFAGQSRRLRLHPLIRRV